MSHHNAPPEYILAFDAGTSSVRAQLFRVNRVQNEKSAQLEPAGDRVAIQYSMSTGNEQELDAVAWAAQVEQAMLEAAAQAPNDATMMAVGATFLHSILGLDSNGLPVTPLYTWADTRSAEAAELLRAKLDADGYHQQTGCFLHPCFPFTRLFRLRESGDIPWSKVRHWVSSGGWLHRRWTGRATVSHGLAAGSGLYDLNEQKWSEPLTGELDLTPANLEELIPHDRRLRIQSGAGVNLPANLAQLLPVWPDAACSNLGSGCLDAHRWALNLGTSGALRVITAPPAPGTVPPDLFCYRLTPDKVLLGGATNNCGSLIKWLARTLQLGEGPLTYAAIKADAGKGPLPEAIPHLAGERSPGWKPRTAGAWAGLRLDTTPAALALSMLDAMAEQFGGMASELRKAAGTPEAVVAGGGGATDPSLVKRIEQAIGAPVVIADDAETTLLGVVRHAARYL
jgi:gluconokinase